MYERLGEEQMPWRATEVFQVDERVAPAGASDRNWTHAVCTLPIERLRGAHPMPVAERDLDAAATAYADLLPDRLDLVHLGLGPDGHTASLMPGDPLLDTEDRRVGLTGGKYRGHRRMTLTYPALAAARRILWLVTGADKRDALARLLDGDRSIPAGRVAAANSSIVADRAAAG
jgi:6-phosphogluconolactonase